MSYLPSLPNASLMDVFNAYPDLASPLHAFAHALMRGPSPFSAAEREVIAAYVSGLNGCEFCLSSHAAAAEYLGVPAKTVHSLLLLQDADLTVMSPKLGPVLNYVRTLTRVPAQLTPAQVEAVYQAGWDETALCHAALVCGFFNLMNRWVEGLGIKADGETAQMAARFLHTHGYEGLIKMLERGSKP